ALALAGGAAALVLTRGGAASPPDAAIDAPPPDAPAPPDAPPPDAAVDAELPPDAAPAPKVIHVPQTGGTDFLALPAAHQSPEAIAAWNEVARLVSEGRFRRGLQALDAYDQQFGATEESKILREALADAPPDRAGWPP
ncbi:MAG: hypothetical protein K8W52_05345, partial [Deltaproteobacteria bacterium]|nr:hypothetical protein [Deltaproteobacteria bacterium]